MVADVSEHALGDPKHAAMHGNIPMTVGIPVAQIIGKKELCRQEIALWNLLHDMDIESIKLRKG